MARRSRRRHRKNKRTRPSVPWLIYGIAASGLLSLWLWKQANPGKSLNPFPTSPTPV